MAAINMVCDETESREIVDGFVTKILFQHKDTSIVYIATTQDSKKVNVLIDYGVLLGPPLSVGEHIVVFGQYEYHDMHGDQLKAKEVKRYLIKKSHLVADWITYNKEIKGVGPSRVNKLIEAYPDNLIATLTEGNAIDIAGYVRNTCNL